MDRSQNNSPGKQGFQRTHGLRKRPEYPIWNGMKQRCHNPNYKAFERYGARGIVVCQEWRDSFARFFEDMGPRPTPAHSIERIDNDGPYEPGNCRWATLDEQANNKRRTIKVGGKTITEIAQETGLDKKTIRARFYQGNTERILSPETLRRKDIATLNKGESNGQAKLTEADVLAILAERAGGKQMKDIAPMFGISKSLVSAICTGKRWGWIQR
jgi:transposase